MTCDVLVVGAGAAGLAAGIFAAEAGGRGRRVLLLDGANRIGAKILISGGGRCNVTHEVVTAADFHGNRPAIRNVLSAFGVPETVRWFASLGVELVREPNGKLFPATGRSRTVLDALLGRCRELGVEIRTGCRVDSIAVEEGGAFRIVHRSGSLRARSVILATGGRSVPKTGSDGSGYAIARSLGHTVTPTHPALVPLVLERGGSLDHAALSGVSHEAEITTRVAGRAVDRRCGSLLWTHFGVSGPVVMDASRFWTGAAMAGAAAELRCSFLPGERAETAEAWFDDAAIARPQRTVGSLVASRLPERVAVALARGVGVEPEVRLGNLSRGARRSLARVLTEFSLPVVRDRGWNHAEVTAGGVPLREIDFRTMASKKTPGLFLVGEILDCDGRIGGFNFQWAWSSGFVGGHSAFSFKNGTRQGS